MKFLYEYRTSDNAKHSGVISAPDREAAFASLKGQGIRPASLVEAPGFFNRLFGKGKRWLVIAALVIICAALFCSLRTEQAVNSAFESTTRRQIIGDSAVIEYGLRTAWQNVFANDGERWFAAFAVPGSEAVLHKTPEKVIREALAREVAIEADDGLEERQIKSIVEGMKAECRRFLEKGGTIEEYGQRLVKRQNLELEYYNRAKNELEVAEKQHLSQAELLELWEKRNRQLRLMGIRLVPMPE